MGGRPAPARLPGFVVIASFYTVWLFSIMFTFLAIPAWLLFGYRLPVQFLVAYYFGNDDVLPHVVRIIVDCLGCLFSSNVLASCALASVPSVRIPPDQQEPVLQFAAPDIPVGACETAAELFHVICRVPTWSSLRRMDGSYEMIVTGHLPMNWLHSFR